MSLTEEKLEMAKMMAKKKMGFLRHLFIFAAVMIMLVIINNATWAGYQWWLWPALGWGIGVLSHFFSVYEGSRWERRLYEKEVERLNDEQ